MRYPVLSDAKCRELADQFLSGERPSVDAYVLWTTVGDETEVDLAPFEQLTKRVSKGASEWTDRDRDRYEGKVSVDLYQTLHGLPAEVLDDRGFWRFLALKYFWDFIAWREEAPFSSGNHLKYVNAAAPTESVLTRMYMRAQSLGGGDHGDLASAIPRSTDFWRSHVLRVRTGTSPALTRAFATYQRERRASSPVLRETARNLNRLWTNVVLHVYDDDEADSIVSDMWPVESHED